MWKIKVSDAYERREKQFRKSHPRELKFVANNLDNFLGALNAGTRSRDIKLGCVHPEPGGVLTITEKGAGSNAIPLRLYVYPDNDAKILYIITLGNKKTQHDDIQFCKASLKKILTEGPDSHVQDEDL